MRSNDILSESAAMKARYASRRHSIGRDSRQLKRNHTLKKLMRASLGVGGILLVAMVAGLVLNGIGITGTIIMMLVMFAVFIGLMAFPRMKVPTIEAVRKSDLPELAGKTEVWLESQRPALPAPAQLLIDNIGVQLDQLSPQLSRLGEDDPAAHEIRRLVGEHLPEMIEGYKRVPQSLRRKDYAGSTPEQQLTEGLRVIEREIDTMTGQISRGELDQLATRGRYLEIKYAGGDERSDPAALSPGTDRQDQS